MSAKRLIVNADDYGNTPGLTRGILEAHHKGIVTSTSVMIISAGVIADLQQAINEAPNLGLGLHLTLSGAGNRPILPPQEVRTLVDDNGTFYPFDGWIEHFARFNPDEIARELTAQCECFADVLGRPPDHLDGHHHVVYRHPAALQTLIDLAHRYRVPIRNPGLTPDDHSTDRVTAELLAELPAHIRNDYYQQVKILFGTLPTARPDHFEASFYEATSTLGDLLIILTNLPEGTTELMCHPGYVDERLISDYTTMREAELKVLTHKSAREVIAAEGIELINYRQL
jgi:chitin disaccharide deacetylase